MTKQADTDKKVAELIKLGNKVLASRTKGHQKQYLDEKLFHDFRISSLSFLTIVFGTKSPFYVEFQKDVTTATPSRTERALGILEAVKRELQGEWLTSIKTELYGKFERDLLGIARKHANQDQLLNAILFSTGILDNHLQQFASQNNLNIERQVEGSSVPYTAVQLNSRIYKKGLYPRPLNKKIFAWLELKEQATTSGLEDIDAAQVTAMIDGIAALCIEFPVNYLD